MALPDGRPSGLNSSRTPSGRMLSACSSKKRLTSSAEAPNGMPLNRSTDDRFTVGSPKTELPVPSEWIDRAVPPSMDPSP